MGIRDILRRWPKAFSLLQYMYRGFRRILEVHLVGTVLQEWIWKTRHMYKGNSWAKEYLHSINHPHREQIVAAIESFSPFNSVLEIGCNSGPNLILLTNKFPHAKLVGIDINHNAINVGKEHLLDSGINNIELNAGKADKLDWIQDRSVDIVFTDAVLMFIGRDKINKVLKEMGRIASKGLVLNEFHSLTPPPGNYEGGRWVYNYEQLLYNYFPSAKVEIGKSKFAGGGWDQYGALIKVGFQEDLNYR